MAPSTAPAKRAYGWPSIRKPPRLARLPTGENTGTSRSAAIRRSSSDHCRESARRPWCIVGTNANSRTLAASSSHSSHQRNGGHAASLGTFHRHQHPVCLSPLALQSLTPVACVHWPSRVQNALKGHSSREHHFRIDTTPRQPHRCTTYVRDRISRTLNTCATLAVACDFV